MSVKYEKFSLQELHQGHEEFQLVEETYVQKSKNDCIVWVHSIT